MWKSYLTQTIACREQLDESMTEASVFSEEMRERWPNSGEIKPNDQSLSLTLQKMSQSLIQKCVAAAKKQARNIQKLMEKASRGGMV